MQGEGYMGTLWIIFAIFYEYKKMIKNQNN